MASTRKDVAKSVKTLIVMLQSLKEQQVTITLRNDTLVRGSILGVDANMNVELKDATVELDGFYCTQTSSEQETTNNTNILEDIDLQKSANETVVDTKGLIVRDCSEVQSDICPSHRLPTLVDNNDEDEEVHDEPSAYCATVYDYFVVKGTRIRHIDLPTDLDLVGSAKGEIERIRNRRKQWSKKDIVRPTNH